ncbi:MAG TPA: DUF421 domain-containing protein [Clostridia bacterium]|nr:DUF421 domain-containing protein [Clostridia bacterium]
MLVLFARAIILYLLVFVIIRLTGKRQISDLQPYDLIMTLLIADLASEPASNTGIPLLYGVVPILALFLVQQIISALSLKSEKMRSLLCGTPLIVISRGVVQEKVLHDARYTLSDLLEQLRDKDVFELSSVEYAILETNGNLSVLLKGPSRTPTLQDLQLASPAAALAYVLIQDGSIHEQALRQAGHDEPWLLRQLARIDIKNPNQVLIAQLNENGILHTQLKAREGSLVRFVSTKESL